MKLRSFEIVQQLEYLDMAKVTDVLNNKSSIRDWAYIIHDKDVNNDNEPVKPHIHLCVRLKDSYDSKYISNWFNVAENYICKIKGRWSDMLSYLTHKNAPEKHQYDDNEVISNFDWVKVRDSGSGDVRKNEIVNLIVNGDIREFNYFDYISIEEYDKYKRSIDNAFKYRLDKIKGVARNMECVFITGDSGTGKTTYAKKIAAEKNYSIFVSSGSNDVLDDYKGQDCIILDDLRPSCMGLSDLLKMLDNHTASSIKSRYKNKVLECKMIIITTTLDIDNFFANVFADEKETSIQLKRRCSVMLRFDMDYVYNYLWQNKSRKYSYVGKLPNPITLEMKMEDMDKASQLNKLAEILGLSKDMIDNIKDDIDEYEVPTDPQIEW